jgi:hypothetical protein
MVRDALGLIISDFVSKRIGMESDTPQRVIGVGDADTLRISEMLSAAVPS